MRIRQCLMYHTSLRHTLPSPSPLRSYASTKLLFYSPTRLFCPPLLLPTQTKVIFTFVQGFYTLVCFVPAKFMFNSFWVHTAWLLLVFGASVWNGARYYIDVFTVRVRATLDYIRLYGYTLYGIVNTSTSISQGDAARAWVNIKGCSRSLAIRHNHPPL